MTAAASGAERERYWEIAAAGKAAEQPKSSGEREAFAAGIVGKAWKARPTKAERESSFKAHAPLQKSWKSLLVGEREREREGKTSTSRKIQFSLLCVSVTMEKCPCSPKGMQLELQASLVSRRHINLALTRQIS